MTMQVRVMLRTMIAESALTVNDADMLVDDAIEDKLYITDI